MKSLLDTPWKLANAAQAVLCWPFARVIFLLNGVPWSRGSRLVGLPLILKHRKSTITIGEHLQLRSSIISNPLGPNHPVIICTWQAGARLAIGGDFAMTGGSICCAESIQIGNHVNVGANTTIVDTDFHPLDAEARRTAPAAAKTCPVVIEDDVFIGMNCVILKGVTIGQGSVIGAGSVVTCDIPAGTIAAGNPARPIRALQ